MSPKALTPPAVFIVFRRLSLGAEARKKKTQSAPEHGDIRGGDAPH